MMNPIFIMKIDKLKKQKPNIRTREPVCRISYIKTFFGLDTESKTCYIDYLT